MKALVVGCGSIGERHIKNLKNILNDEILACDKDTSRLKTMKEKHGAIVFDDLNKVWSLKPDIIYVCTPPSSHIKIALEAVKHGSHVFIEKPMSHSSDGIDDLLRTAEKNNLHVFVGYNFRFEKGMQIVKKMLDEKRIGTVFSARAEFGQYLPDWRPWQDYKKSYTSRKDLGGGIILDGSHEIDYMRWLLGDVDYISCFADKVSNLDVETEDIAEIMMKFKNGIICEVHLDFIRHGYSRNCEIIGEKGVIYWDFAEKTVKLYDSNKKKWDETKLPSDINDMYIEETKHVINTISNNNKPLIDGFDGKKTLEVALAAKKSAETNEIVKL
jgi:predicted dehydrogenase